MSTLDAVAAAAVAMTTYVSGVDEKVSAEIVAGDAVLVLGKHSRLTLRVCLNPTFIYLHRQAYECTSKRASV